MKVVRTLPSILFASQWSIGAGSRQSLLWIQDQLLLSLHTSSSSSRFLSPDPDTCPRSCPGHSHFSSGPVSDASVHGSGSSDRLCSSPNGQLLPSLPQLPHPGGPLWQPGAAGRHRHPRHHQGGGDHRGLQSDRVGRESGQCLEKHAIKQHIYTLKSLILQFSSLICLFLPFLT